MTTKTKRVNLLNFDLASLRDYFLSLGEKKYHADQIFSWMHKQALLDFDQMTNISRSLRDYLKEHAEISLPTVAREQISSDGTQKWLLKLHDDLCIEMVYIPEKDRGTLCVSSQVGCAMNCFFCSTGQQGFKRNLTVAEIVGQLWIAQHQCQLKVTNVVFMGMGEPLLNLENVVAASNIMMDDLAYGLSKYKVTVSTCGIVPMMDKLAEMSEAALAVSLHAPNDEIRNQIMPINKKYPLTELITACKRFFKKETGRQISFEYILIKDFNDQPKHAKELIKLLQGVPAKVNLIPYNPVPNLPYDRPTQERVDEFCRILLKSGIRTMMRKTRGEDIDAACGQLAGKES
jgi:23S rRNA (adenine2503-C2)-methyltransferase